MAQFPGYIYHKNAWIYDANLDEMRSDMERTPDERHNNGEHKAEIRNFEDFDLHYYKDIRRLVETFKVCTIIVYRGVRNWLASQVRKYSITGDSGAISVNIDAYDQFLKEVHGETHLVPNKLCISFDKWFSNQKYREDIATLLELDFTDNGLNDLGIPGAGSSFDGYKFTDNAQHMNVLNRHEQMKDYPIYNFFMKDERLMKWEAME
jgi:hypothetical protein